MSLALVAAGQQVDPDLRVMQSMTMTQHLAMSRLPSQIGAVLLSAFAVMGMALAAIGVYGTVRYTVAMRTREVGIRMALGADAAGVARLLATHGVRLVLVGGVIGVAASLLAARFLATLLFGVGTLRSCRPDRCAARARRRGMAGCLSARAARQSRGPARGSAHRLIDVHVGEAVEFTWRHSVAGITVILRRIWVQ